MISKVFTLFGGTFDPIHMGHIKVALSAGEILSAEKVILIPAKRSVLKPNSPIASYEQRVSMLKLAIEGKSLLEISDWELNRPAPSYTIDTIRHFKEVLGEDNKLHWLIGADSVDDLSRWYKVEELIDECYISVMYRAGYPKPDFRKYLELWGDKRIKMLEGNVIETPLVNVSSTDIRKGLAEGNDTTGMLDPGVADYIQKHKLYAV